MQPRSKIKPFALALFLSAACGVGDTSAINGAPPTDDGGALDVIAPIDAGADTPLLESSALPDTGPSVDAVSPPTTNPVGKQDLKLTVDGVSRDFIVYVPRGAATIEAPVVFMFHGTSQNGEQFYSDSKWREKADEVGTIVVFPTALSYCYKEDENHDGDFDDPGEVRIATKWTIARLGSDDGLPLCTPEEMATFPPTRQMLADHPLRDDILFVDAMNAFLATHYRIDPRRIYATGFSNGAGFTGRLVAERSNVFASAAAGSAPMGTKGSLASRPMTAALWVGSKDGKFLPDGVKELPVGESLLTEYPVLKSGWIGQYLTTLGLADTYTYSERTVGGRKVATFLYATSNVGGRNTFAFSILEGMTHLYPNGANYPVSAPDSAWTMFQRESLP